MSRQRSASSRTRHCSCEASKPGVSSMCCSSLPGVQTRMLTPVRAGVSITTTCEIDESNMPTGQADQGQLFHKDKDTHLEPISHAQLQRLQNRAQNRAACEHL